MADPDPSTESSESPGEVRPDGSLEHGPKSGRDGAPARPTVEPRRGLIGWLQRMAYTKVAFPLLMLLTFADGCISPIVPEVMLVPMCLARRDRVRFYGITCAIASVLGGCFGFWLGAELWESIKDVIFELPGFGQEDFENISKKLAGHTFFWIFVAGFTPLPFKLFAVTAGVMHQEVEFWVFFAAAALSRTLRFLLEVWLIRAFGPTVLGWLERRMKLVLILSGVAIAAYYLLR